MRRIIVFTILWMVMHAAATAALTMDLNVSPPEIDAQNPYTLTIETHVYHENGAPAPDAVVVFSADGLEVSQKKPAGDGNHVSQQQPQGDGLFRAFVYVPLKEQKERKPGFIFILAAARSGNEVAVSGVAVPVTSHLEFSGKTRPGTKLRAKAGDALFGEPVSADANGDFSMSLIVPPGYDTIYITAENPDYPVPSQTPIKVGFDIDDRFFAKAFPETVIAGGEPGYVNILAVGQGGIPLEKAPLAVQCSPGLCDSPVMLSPGLFQARYTPPVTVEREHVDVSVALSGVKRTEQINLAPAGIYSVSVVAERNEVYAGESIHFNVNVLDHALYPLHGAVIEMLVNNEPSAEKVVEKSAGVYEFSKTTSVADGPEELVFSARAYLPETPDTIVTSDWETVFVKESTVRLTTESAAPDITPEEKTEIEIIAELEETRTGVENLSFEISPEIGTTGKVRETGQGRYVFEYTAPKGWHESEIEIQVEADAPGRPVAIHRLTWNGPTPALMTMTPAFRKAEPGTSLTISLEVRDEGGTGVAGQNITLSAPGASVGTVVDSGGGKYASIMTVSSPADPGTMRIDATCDCGGMNLAADTEIEILAMAPAGIEVAANPDQIYVAEGIEADVTVDVKDKLGHGVADTSLQITISQNGGDTTDTAETDSGGRAEFTVELQPVAGVAEITVAVADTPVLSKTVNVEVLRYPIAKLELSAALSEIPADGVTSLEIEALGIDETGGDAIEERIDFVLNHGSGRLNGSDCTTGGDGRCTLDYTAGVACGTVSVEAFAYSDDTVRSTFSFEETPAIPADMELTDDVPTDLMANNSDTWDVEVLVTDAGGCPVVGETVDFSVAGGSGSIESFAVTNNQGKATARYTTGLVDGTVTILAVPRTSPMLIYSMQVEVLPWRPSAYRLTPASLSQTAGAAFNLTVTALDSRGNTLASFDQSLINISFSGPSNAPGGTSPSFPADAAVKAAMVNGVSVVPVTLYAAETTTISINDGYATGTTASITVAGAAGASFDVSADSSQTAGTQFTVSLTARDAYGNIATYNPAGKTFSESGPSTSPSPVSKAPDYPSSAALIALFSNGSAAMPVTLYAAETASITVNDGAISGTSNAITVSRAAVDRIFTVSGDSQSQSVTKNLGAMPVVRVTDAWGNPVQGDTVTFILTQSSGAGGAVTGSPKTTNSSGEASPDTWIMGNAIGTNKITASMAAGTTTSVVITASGVVPGPYPVISRVDPPSKSYNICPGDDTPDTLTVTSVNSTASDVSNIVSRRWDFTNDGIEDSTAIQPPAITYNATGTYTLALSVTDDFGQTATDTETVEVSHVYGPLSLSASTSTIGINGETATITSGTIYECGNTPIADGTLFTVSTTLGTITDTDQDTAPGKQITSNGGTISFTLQSGPDSGVATVSAASKEFPSDLSASRNITIVKDENVPPYVVNYTPAGLVAGLVNEVVIVFSEAVQVNTFMDLRITQGGPVPGNWSYDSGTRRAVFSPFAPIDVSGMEAQVTVKQSIHDFQGAGLDGEYKFDGSSSDFTFSFANAIACAQPTTTNCSVSAATFSPDPSDGLPNTTTFSFDVNDNYYIYSWRMDIIDGGGALIKSMVQTNSTCCSTDCTDAVPACVLCCGTGNGCCTDQQGIQMVWNGKNLSDHYVPNGNYTIRAMAYDLYKCNPVAPCETTVTVSNPIGFMGFGP